MKVSTFDLARHRHRVFSSSTTDPASLGLILCLYLFTYFCYENFTTDANLTNAISSCHNELTSTIKMTIFTCTVA